MDEPSKVTLKKGAIMNDFETRLQGGTAKPRRSLREDFTSQTIAAIREQPHEPKYRPKWKEYIPVKLFHKPAAIGAAFALTIAIGGSAYAAVGGISGIKALFGGETPLSNGDRIVKVDTQACPHVNAFNVTNKNRTPNGSVYYRVKASSKLTNEQVVQVVQGYCEADSESTRNGSLAQTIVNLPENKDKTVAWYGDTTVTSVSTDHITVAFDMYGTKGHPNELQHVVTTFNHIDPHAVVIHNGTKQTMADLKPGDHVGISYRAIGDALAHSETMPPDQLNTDETTVILVTKLSDNMKAYYSYSKYNGREFEQVAPCDKNPSGYCDAGEYLSQ
jgi:hypothetical protein